jgi:hypothetical protein
VEATLGTHWGIHFDAQDHIFRMPRFGLPTSSPGRGRDFFPIAGVGHMIEPSLGLLYSWPD